MKKIISIFIIGLLTFGLIGCEKPKERVREDLLFNNIEIAQKEKEEEKEKEKTEVKELEKENIEEASINEKDEDIVIEENSEKLETVKEDKEQVEIIKEDEEKIGDFNYVSQQPVKSENKEVINNGKEPIEKTTTVTETSDGVEYKQETTIITNTQEEKEYNPLGNANAEGKLIVEYDNINIFYKLNEEGNQRFYEIYFWNKSAGWVKGGDCSVSVDGPYSMEHKLYFYTMLADVPENRQYQVELVLYENKDRVLEEKCNVYNHLTGGVIINKSLNY